MKGENIMATLKTEWKSTEPNPDEDHLKTLWQKENENFERTLAKAAEASKRRKDKTLPLVKASGLTQADIDKFLKEDKDLSAKSLKEVEQQLAMQPIDFKALHQKDHELAQANAKRIVEHNPSWSGYIWNPSYGGWWSSWNGEAEEIPNVTFDVGANRFDPRAQAWGEGWYDSDFSKLDVYLAFRLTPPSWGHLHVYVYYWMHGYYSLYSNDTWYKSEYAKAELNTWVDAHQNYWRSRDFRRRFIMSGYELHPTRADRIDRFYSHSFYTNVGERDLITIRSGVQLYCRGKANGGRAKLNFQAGSANYVYVPYVYWYLHH